MTFRVGQVEGYLGPPVLRRTELAELYAEALEAGIETAYCKRVVRDRGLPIPADRPAPEQWPWKVRIHVLGGFRLLLEDAPYEVTHKAPSKTLELLKAIVVLGGKDVSLERLEDMLWPEAEGDRAGSNIKTTINRLRKLLGGHEYLLVQSGQISLNPEYCWSDLRRFEDVTRRITGLSASSGVPPHPPAQLAEHLQQLRAAYPAPLLTNDAEDWVPGFRKRLHTRYGRALGQLVRLLHQAGDHEAAQSALDASVTREELSDRVFS